MGNRGGNVLRHSRVYNQKMGRRTQIRNFSPQIASSPHTSNKHNSYKKNNKNRERAKVKHKP